MADFSDIVNELKKTNSKLDELKQATDPSGAAAAEEKRDAANAAARSEGYLKTIADAVSGAGGKGDGLDPKDKKRGGLLAGIGGAVSSMGIGAGAAMAGMGALFAGGGYLLKQISEFDGKKVYENVKELLKINDLFTGSWDALKKGGTFFIVMTALGAGLVAFSAGTGVAAAVTYFTKDVKWAEDIKKNVETLLSINIGTMAGVAELATTMAALALGLIAFSIGSVTATAATGIDAAIGMFINKGKKSKDGKTAEGTGWAQKIKDNVELLLSINVGGLLGVAGLATALAALGAGLIAFSFGSAAGAAATGIDSAISMFTGSKQGQGTGWAAKIKSEVETLLSINVGEGFGAWAQAIVGLPAALAALGLGVLAFSIGKTAGAAATGIDSAISMFTGSKEGMGTGWAAKIKSEVETLLSIKVGGLGAYAKAIVGFPLVMGAIALGLIAFSIGKVVASGAEAAASSFSPSEKDIQVTKKIWFEKTGWAQTIVNEVTTLLKIAALPLVDAVKFPITMGLIAAGLVAFSVGKLAAGAAEGLVTGIEQTTKSIDQFSNVGFAQKIVNEVTKLLEIASLPLGDAAKFVATMGLIGAGLVAFSLGKGAAGAAEAVNRFAGIGQEGGGKSFAEKIKSEVVTLLSVLDEPGVDQKKADDFSKIMGTIAAGLVKISAGKLIGSLASAASGVLNFLSGSDSPIQEVMKLAAKSEDLTKGAKAMSQIGDGLDKMAALKFDGSEVNVEEFAEDLMKSVPALEVAIAGGEIGKGWFSSGTKIRGLANPDVGWAEAATNLNLLRRAMGMKTEKPGGAGGADASKLSAARSEGYLKIIADDVIERTHAYDDPITGELITDHLDLDGKRETKFSMVKTMNVNTIIAQTLLSNAMDKSVKKSQAEEAASAPGVAINTGGNDQRVTTSSTHFETVNMHNPDRLVVQANDAGGF